NSVSLIHADDFIDHYFETTSDHLPVAATFILKRDQSIAFSPLAPKTYGDVSFALSAEATSLQPVVYTSSDSNIASIAGNEIVILKAGMVDITASQPGDSTYYPALEISQKLFINKAGQRIVFDAVMEKTVGDAPFEMLASATSALPVIFSPGSPNISVDEDRITMLRAGRALVVASQAGNENYLPASVNVEFCVAPSVPVVTSDLSVPVMLSSNAAAGNQWFVNGSPIAGATGNKLSTSGPGIYKVQVRADDCLSLFSNEIQVAVTSLPDDTDFVLQVFPNPAIQFTEIQVGGEIISLNVYDLRGMECNVPIERQGSRIRMLLFDLSPGIYVVRINDGQKVRTVRLVRQ
ncbi:MAG TPA: T9SS type A sorting domain-containing protein, partial [Cyclobacteriaceae bacterium]|nr:T9SS type A sorting domain-containing protein [Cyclobacteriaceae bacterium]